MSNANTEKTGKWGALELGALWTKVSKDKTQKFFTGHITTPLDGKVELVIFSNKDKKNEKSPDFRIYLSEPKKDSEASAPPAAKAKVAAAPSKDDEEMGVL
jgi:uncharacterized protein (DUF736 family)